MTEEKVLEYTLFTPFGGIGGGAFGFLQAESHLFGVRAKFRLIGGIDFDRESCDDFEYLCGVPQACLDVSAITVKQLRALVGARRPDVLILSPPCKGSSKLIGAKLASSPKYIAMNRLAEVWTELMLAAWGDDLPRLIIFENVPNITTRAAAMLRRIRNLLTKAGYAIQDGYHECGAVGGLAQRRRRWFMVARLKASVPRFLYQAPAKRIRGCGEVLKMLPLPGDPAGGPMHALPAISIINQIRLALIPPGGDWRDLPGILAEGQARRTLFRRRHLEAWTDPSITVAGPGSNGPYAVADPRPSDLVPIKCEPRRGAYGVTGWATASGTVVGAACIDNGRFAVADPRPALGLPFAYANVDRVYGWSEPVGTITHAPAPSSGAPAVADPRPGDALAAGGAFSNSNRVTSWFAPVPTIVSKGSPASGGPAVADPRINDLLVGFAYPHAYAVLGWSQPSFTIHGQSMPGCGAYSVADPRVFTGHGDALGVLVWDEAARTITGRATVTTGAFAVASPVIPQAGNEDMHWGKYVVVSWSDPVRTIAGASRVGSGAQSVADPRASGFKGVYGVTAWGTPSTTVTANARACTGSFSVADPRFPGSMGVVEWTEPASTVAGESYPSNGAFAVADPRADALPRGVIALDEIMDVLEHPEGSVFAIIDPRKPHEPVAFIDDIKRPAYRLELVGTSRSKKGRPTKPRYKRVSVPLVILSEDTPGVFSWHRALTTAELAALQGFPILHNGAPFQLVGGSTGQRERIGNAIPPPTAKAIGEQMLLCLLSADTGIVTMGTGVVWVSPDAPWVIGDVAETIGVQ